MQEHMVGLSANEKIVVPVVQFVHVDMVNNLAST